MIKDSRGLETKFDKFHQKLIGYVNQHCVERKIKVSTKAILKEPWLTKGIINAGKIQLCLYKSCLSSNDLQKHDKYKQYKELLCKIKRNAKCRYYFDQCSRFKSNTKKLWEVINSISGKCHDKTKLIDHIKVNGVKIEGEKNIGNEFTKYVLTIGLNLAAEINKSDITIDEYIMKIPLNGETFYLHPCTVDEVMKLIGSMKNKNSYGYDKISNVILKAIAPSITWILCRLFNESMTVGKFPTSMKFADVVPLFKTGEHELLTNYRPISLLLTLSKVLEKLLYSRIYNFVDIKINFTEVSMALGLNTHVNKQYWNYMEKL